jgi:hypothetical protein
VYDEGDRVFADIWHTGLLPLDAGIFAQPPCRICQLRAAHPPTSPQGRHEILNSANFNQLDRARAIGGATCLLVANTRDAALQKPDDQFLQKAMMLCSNTVFRFLLRDQRKVASRRPESIVPLALFFLHDCRWLRSGAALLTQIALWKMQIKNENRSAPAATARAISGTLRRGDVLQRSPGSIDMLLTIDGTVRAAELLKLTDPHSE